MITAVTSFATPEAVSSWASDEKLIHFNKKKRVKYLKNRPL